MSITPQDVLHLIDPSPGNRRIRPQEVGRIVQVLNAHRHPTTTMVKAQTPLDTTHGCRETTDGATPRLRGAERPSSRLWDTIVGWARQNEPAMEEALWKNVQLAPWFLARRLRGAGLELHWAGTVKTLTARRGRPTARITGPPGELLLYLFGRQGAARVELDGPPAAVEAVRHARFGMYPTRNITRSLHEAR